MRVGRQEVGKHYRGVMGCADFQDCRCLEVWTRPEYPISRKIPESNTRRLHSALLKTTKHEVYLPYLQPMRLLCTIEDLVLEFDLIDPNSCRLSP